MADDIGKALKKDSLRVLFLLICAEAIAKLYVGSGAVGKSRFYTQKFFERFISAAERKRIETGFVGEGGFFKLKAAIDHLYNIRCDVAHEGRYWEFNFSSDGMVTHTVGATLHIGVKISYPIFRDIVVRGAIRATLSKMSA